MPGLSVLSTKAYLLLPQTQPSDKNTRSARVASELYLASFPPPEEPCAPGEGPRWPPWGGRQVPAGLMLTPWPVWSRVLGRAGGVLLRQEAEAGGRRPPGRPCQCLALPGGRAQPGQGAGALHSACVGLERRPDASSQGLWRGALGGAAHGQALRSQGVGRGGADGRELQGEDTGVSAEPQASRGDVGGGGCRARRTPC